MPIGRPSAWISVLLALAFGADECANPAPSPAGVGSRSAGGTWPRLQAPRTQPALADIVGLDAAKSVLHQAVVVPLLLPADDLSVFWRSRDRSAALLVGPSGLGKSALVEACAAAVGAHVVVVSAEEALQDSFCKVALAAGSQPVVAIVEGLEAAPGASVAIYQCLRRAAAVLPAPRLAIVATMNRALGFLKPSSLQPFSYVAQLQPPNEAERKQFLLQLLASVARVDSNWGSALRESSVTTLAALTSNMTFAEIEFIVRRTFVQSSFKLGADRDPVALHHFEQALAQTVASSVSAFNDIVVIESHAADPVETIAGRAISARGNKTASKDPMEGIFGWCNFFLPQSMQLPPLVWALIFLGILAHFMAQASYPGQRKKRGSAKNSLFADLSSYPSFPKSDADGMDWYGPGGPGPGGFSNFPPPPGVPSMRTAGKVRSGVEQASACPPSGGTSVGGDNRGNAGDGDPNGAVASDS